MVERMKNLEWIKLVPKPERYLSGDARLICEELDVDAFIGLYDRFRKSRVDFSDSHLNRLREEYVKLYYVGTNESIKAIARVLEVSPAFIRRIVEEKIKKEEIL
mgnify:CR=1 FL=1